MSIDEKDLARLDERYRRKDECEDKMSATDSRVDDLKTDVEVVKTKLNILIGILSAIGVGVLGIALKLIFGGNA